MSLISSRHDRSSYLLVLASRFCKIYSFSIFGPEVSKTEGRVAQTTNVVIGGTVTDDSTNEWLALDQKVKCSFVVH